MITRQSQRGMSFLELMAVLIIMGILAAIAIPQYNRYVLKGHRVEARNALQAIATEMARVRRIKNKYQSIDLNKYQTQNYQISLEGLTDSTYSAVATAINGQTNDYCQVFKLNQTGVESARIKDEDKNHIRDAVTKECWGS